MNPEKPSCDACQPPAISLRPYQLLCLVCSLGEARADPATRAKYDVVNGRPFRQRQARFLEDLLERIRRRPDLPMALRCNAGDVFAWQEPGTAGDSSEGTEYNVRRDLEIMRRLDLPPGVALPARILLHRLRNMITTTRGICGFETFAAEAWRGCPKADSGFYECGNRIEIDDIVPPSGDAERAAEKEASLAAMETAASITIRPHLLLCMVCQYGAGTRPPLDADNLPELLQMIREKSDTPLTLARGADWMMCAPCKRRVPELNACVNVFGAGGLSNELRDLNVLQILGLTYGTTLPAGELMRLLFERLPTTKPVCTKAHEKNSIWWDSCGDYKSGNPHYAAGREQLMQEGLGRGRGDAS